MEDQTLRTYAAIVWRKDQSNPSERLTLLARDLEDATAQLRAKFGEGCVYSLVNEDAANAPR